jgi:cytochrome P450
MDESACGCGVEARGFGRGLWYGSDIEGEDDMSAATILTPGRAFRPAAPIPHAERLGPLRLLLALRENPAAAWGIWHFEEPVVQARTVLGDTVVFSDPAAIRHVLVDNAASYPKDDLQRRVLAPGLGEGLLTAEGETWKRVRRTLAPLFSPRAVESLAGVMRDRAVRAARRLAAEPKGTRIDVSAEMTRVTFDILSGTLFSDGIVSDADRFAEAVTGYFNTVGRLSPLDAIGAPDWIPRLSRLRGRPAISFFEAEVARIIARRQGEIAGGNAPDDLLTRLIRAADPETGVGLTEAEVAANIVTFIAAGHETTANALGWTLYLLAKHPDVRARAEAEAATADAHPLAEWPERLPFLRAVFEEAMRLYPPAATLTRQALADDMVEGVKVPKGALVIVSPYVVHRHRMLWRDADFFRPERFMPGERETINRFQYLPFGAGHRVCIGQRFAMLEAVIVLAETLCRVRLDWPERRAVMPVQRVTLRPEPGLVMTKA